MSKNTNLSFLTDYITADITNGRIGINNASPAYAFDVTGVAKFSSSVGIGNPSAIEGVLTIKGTSAQPPTSGTTANSLLQLVGSLGAELNIGSNTVAGGYGSYIQASDNNLAVPYPLLLQPNGGSVGIGTNSPFNTNGYTSFTINGTTGSIIEMLANGTRSMQIVAASDISYFYGALNTPMAWYTNATERMRITSGGQVCIGTTTAGVQNTPLCLVNSTQTARIWSTGPNTSGDYVVYNNSGGGISGVYLGYGATTWTSNSDERLKNITGNIDNALNDLMTLKTVKHTWKLSDNNKEYLALIAQNVQKVFPQVIDTNEEGFLGVRYVELLPVLIKAIQELKAEIDTLKNK